MSLTSSLAISDIGLFSATGPGCEKDGGVLVCHTLGVMRIVMGWRRGLTYIMRLGLMRSVLTFVSALTFLRAMLPVRIDAIMLAMGSAAEGGK